MKITNFFGALVYVAAFALFSHCVSAGEILKSSVAGGLPPVATVLSWQCPDGTTSAEATSNGNQPVWTGAKQAQGTQKVTGMLATGVYSIKCITPGGSATVTIVPPTPAADGSSMAILGYLLSWGVAPGVWPNPVDVTDPKGGPITLDKLPAGPVYFVAEAYVAPDKVAKSPKSNEIQRTISAGSIVTDSVTVKVFSLPGPPGLK